MLEYFGHTAVAITLLMLILLPLHILRAGPRQKTGIEFWGLDLPDSFLELIYSAIIVIMAERTVEMVYNFITFRLLKSK